MSAPSVLLIDDGELDDVRVLLAQMGAEFVHLRGGQIPAAVEPPRDLFIATTRRALLSEEWPVGNGAPKKIAVVTEDSNTLRNRLRGAGFDLLIRRPVHPYALRLVLMRTLYAGKEKRSEDRIPIGHPVRYRSGLLQKKGTLADLSLGGGRLLVGERLTPGTRITIQMPNGVTDGKPLSVRGTVLRTAAAGENSGGAKYAAALQFEKLSLEMKRRIYGILTDRVHGPAVLPQAVEMDQVSEAEIAAEAINRREDKRVAFEREVLIPSEAESVVMGRDLSMGGMRIHPHPNLKLGDRIDIALYGNPREEPTMLKAVVVRDEDDGGFGLAFQNVEVRVAEKLEKLIAQLPAIEPLQEGESESMGSVVSRILDCESDAA